MSLSPQQFHPAVPALGAVTWPKGADSQRRAYVCADCHPKVHEHLTQRGITPEFHPHNAEADAPRVRGRQDAALGGHRWCEVHSGNVREDWLR